MSSVLEWVESRLVTLPVGLRKHIERARVVARELAELHGVDAQSVDLGTAAHDLARAMRPRELVEEAERLGLALSEVEREEPILLHGPVAAAWLRAHARCSSRLVLEAVHYHTTGRAGMSDIAKVVFLGDKLDSHKVARFPFLKKVADKSRVSLDLAILEYLDLNIKYLLDRGALIHPLSIELRNELLLLSRACTEPN